MFGKGANTLAFDDFAPVNEPCTFLDFTAHAGRSGLRYLGESQLVEDLPASLAPGSAEILRPLAKDPLALQQTIDVLTNRTFRRSLLCRADAPVRGRIDPAVILNFSVRNPNAMERLAGGVGLLNHDGKELARFEDPLAVAFFSALAETRPESLPVREVLAKTAHVSPDPTQNLLRLVANSARRGLVLLRDEPARFDSSVPEFPNLGALRLIAAEKAQPMADVYHSPCQLDEASRRIALAMDGSRTVGDLAVLAKTIAPKLDFQTWLGHLAARGMFSA
jgi:hypothetical protein